MYYNIKGNFYYSVQKIKKIWPKGPYNIIGVSWGGALTLEIARILSSQGASLHLYFIDGAPHTLQSALKHLGEDNASMETNLLTRILNINDIDVSIVSFRRKTTIPIAIFVSAFIFR